MQNLDKRVMLSCKRERTSVFLVVMVLMLVGRGESDGVNGSGGVICFMVEGNFKSFRS